MDLFDAIARRHSYRGTFAETPIPREHLVKIVSKRTGRTRFEWQPIPNRENHYLDARIYARAAVALLGLDRMAAGRPRSPALPAASSPPVAVASSPIAAPASPAPPAPPRRRESWLSGGRSALEGRGSWLSRRR